MGFRFRKSIRLGGGARLNLSPSGIGASWGFKGFRVGVSPRRRSSGGGMGCLLLLAVGAVMAVIAAVVKAIVALFMTPVPYVAAAIGGAAWLAWLVRRQRLEMRYFDAIAAIHGVEGASPDALDDLWSSGHREADVLVLFAARAAAAGDHAGALSCLHAASTRLGGLGRLSGGVRVWFPGLVEPLWFGGGASAASNLALAEAHVESLAGRSVAVIDRLGNRLHEPHFGAALGALADGYVRVGMTERAAAILQHNLYRVQNAAAQCALRYRLAELLEQLGASTAAMQELRQLLAHGPYRDAAARLSRIEAQLLEEQRRHHAALEAQRQHQVAQRDEAAYYEALDRIMAARGPKSRERALEAGLARIEQGYLRERLLLDASRLEVEAVLEKVAGLKTKKAKERNLHDALDRLRSDSLPDELQRREIEMLEQAIAALESGA